MSAFCRPPPAPSQIRIFLSESGSLQFASGLQNWGGRAFLQFVDYCRAPNSKNEPEKKRFPSTILYIFVGQLPVGPDSFVLHRYHARALSPCSRTGRALLGSGRMNPVVHSIFKSYFLYADTNRPVHLTFNFLRNCQLMIN